jgi:hypothetical protein
MRSDITFKPYWEMCIIIDRWLKDTANSKKKAAKIELLHKGNDQVLRDKGKWLEVSHFI